MDTIKFLTCTPEQSAELVKLGVYPYSAVFWHHLEEDHMQPLNAAGSTPTVWITAMFANPQPCETMRPAWTMQELHCMFGPDINKPDFESIHTIGRAKRDDPFFKSQYGVYFPTKQQNYLSGAQAAAAWLIFLIEKDRRYLNKFLKSANDRFKKTFEL